MENVDSEEIRRSDEQHAIDVWLQSLMRRQRGKVLSEEQLREMRRERTELLVRVERAVAEQRKLERIPIHSPFPLRF